MTGREIQDKLDAIVEDLQGKGVGQTVTMVFRNPNNSIISYELGSDGNGVVDVATLNAIQALVNNWKAIADAYETEYAPVQTALEAFKTAQTPHGALITAAREARSDLNAALEADATYQTAKTALDNARKDAGYISARESYVNTHVSENFGNLGDSKGKYQI